MIPVKFTTENFQLVVPDESYAQVITDYIVRNDTHFKDSSYQSETFKQLEFWQTVLPTFREDFITQKALRLVLISLDDTPKIIGNINFDNIIREPFHACYLGYRMDKDFINKGYMYQALSLAIPFIQNEWKIHRIMANYRPENRASGHLLQKLGFVIEGYANDYLYFDGAWRDHVLTALTKQ